jgi:hypothetical protein
MTIRKVIASDENTIIKLFKKFDDTPVNHDDKRVLFKKQFNCDEDFYGLLIEDQEKVIAYLGLIFVHRTINNQLVKYCNLSSFLIDPDYRGQKLTHKMIDEVLKLGNYTITAITPIPSLYRMYESKGLIKLEDDRVIFWNNRNNQNIWSIVQDEVEIEKKLDAENKQIYLDHKKFNCEIMVLSNTKETLLVIGKVYQSQLRKFKTGKFINYLDFFTRKITGFSFLNKPVDALEIHYCSNYQSLIDNFSHTLPLLCACKNWQGIILRKDICSLEKLNSFKKNNFFRARQLFYSTQISNAEYDTLYSEVYVLDLK